MKFYIVRHKPTGKFLDNNIHYNRCSVNLVDEESNNIAIFNVVQAKKSGPQRNSLWGGLRNIIADIMLPYRLYLPKYNNYQDKISVEKVLQNYIGVDPESIIEYYVKKLYHYNTNRYNKEIEYDSFVNHKDSRFFNATAVGVKILEIMDSRYGSCVLPYECINQIMYLLVKDLEFVLVDVFNRDIRTDGEAKDHISKKAKKVYDKFEANTIDGDESAVVNIF